MEIGYPLVRTRPVSALHPPPKDMAEIGVDIEIEASDECVTSAHSEVGTGDFHRSRAQSHLVVRYLY
jgi:hypothetical protein